MRKKPYTTGEFFYEICKQIELPDILDYNIGSRDQDEIKDIEWDFNTSLNFGGNEGIYLDVDMMKRGYDEHGKWKPTFTHLGTFKTLDESKEAMKRMGELAGEFIYAAHEFIEKNEDDFTWTGYSVRRKESICGWWCPTKENAKKKYDAMMLEHDDIVVFDWSTRKEIKP